MITAAFVVLAGLSATASAQRKAAPKMTEGIIDPRASQEYTLKVDSIKVSDGILAMDYNFGDVVFGDSFLGRTSGDLAGSLMMSLNSAPTTIQGEEVQVVGGSWSLPVYTPDSKFGEIYMGSIYGAISNGKISWDESGTVANLVLVFSVDNGTKNWGGAKGSADFYGTLEVQKGQPVHLSGVMTIRLDAAQE